MAKCPSFPTIVRMGAIPAEIPAQKAVWIASSATDGKPGQLINIFTLDDVLQGTRKEGARFLRNQAADEPDMHVKKITPYQR